MVLRRIFGLGGEESTGPEEGTAEQGTMEERSENNMSAKVLVVYYSTWGHVYQMAQAVAEGSRIDEDTEVRLRQVPELSEAYEAYKSDEYYMQARQMQAEVPEATHDDLRWADGIVWGTPTRYGNMISQMKQFIDTTGSLWQNGELEDKATGVFTSTATIHGGQETTIITSMIPLLHLGMVFVGTPYGQNPHIMTTEGVGGTPYGPSTLAGNDGSRQPAEDEFLSARNLGERVAHVSEHMAQIRNQRLQGQQQDAPAYGEGD